MYHIIFIWIKKSFSSFNVDLFLQNPIQKYRFYIQLVHFESFVSSICKKSPHSFKPYNWGKIFTIVNPFLSCISLIKQSFLIPCDFTSLIQLVLEHPLSINHISIFRSRYQCPCFVLLNLFNFFIHFLDPIFIL